MKPLSGHLPEVNTREKFQSGPEDEAPGQMYRKRDRKRSTCPALHFGISRPKMTSLSCKNLFSVGLKGRLTFCHCDGIPMLSLSMGARLAIVQDSLDLDVEAAYRPHLPRPQGHPAPQHRPSPWHCPGHSSGRVKPCSLQIHHGE